MAFEDIPVRENGQPITYLWFNDLREAGLGSPGWTKYSVPYTDLQTAALTKQVTLVTRAAKETIEGIIIKTATAFVGTSISSLLFDIGLSGDLQRWVADYSGLAAVSDSNHETSSMIEVPSFATTSAIILKATAVGANLSALSAGELEIWIKSGKLE